MKKPCKTCPFLIGTENIGASDWLVDVIIGVKRENLDHSCHRTDPRADGYKAGEPSHCWGFLGMMKNKSNTCISSKASLEIVNGDLDWEDIPTEGIFKSIPELIKHHAKGDSADD